MPEPGDNEDLSAVEQEEVPQPDQQDNDEEPTWDTPFGEDGGADAAWEGEDAERP